ncbi:sugar ABC transporter permease [Vulcanococcus limneticus Candia 3F8]|uniref:carbohydrate ABC transporter permease n=1 Tax=Vulcanococcus limneticus TaxID=2170428 RepID=UPI000B980049|nr:sugar ABC transporter permease [Vulcanococcus limneticus]MCP9792341.1 sugar ABC transporter permease [Vulcanococcus limneticus MW73D5]MCP9893814.1 sugar ABC transporter permease [Vulcanococcus limneticus Candia 3F8]MCP9897690.1 sugar ABC transporter permease [Vulcanococcus limneticus Candia 3B3]
MSLLLLAPALLLVGVVFLWPLLRYAWLSGHAASVLTGLVPLANGGANWQRLLSDGRFWQDTLQTLRFAGVSLSLELLLGLALALLLHQPLRQRGAVRAAVLLPWALPTTVMALGWRWLLNDPYGPLNRLIQGLGGSPYGFLSTPATTWLFTVLADVWKSTPFVALLLLAGLQTIPPELEEALLLEGAGPLQRLWRLTLPLLAPYLLLAALFRLAQALGVFDLIQVLTGGGPASSTESLGLYAYLNGMRFLDFGYSATVMLGMFLLVLLLTSGLLLLRRGWQGTLR